jgi:hypothetical protein
VCQCVPPPWPSPHQLNPPNAAPPRAPPNVEAVHAVPRAQEPCSAGYDDVESGCGIGKQHKVLREVERGKGGGREKGGQVSYREEVQRSEGMPNRLDCCRPQLAGPWLPAQRTAVLRCVQISLLSNPLFAWLYCFHHAPAARPPQIQLHLLRRRPAAGRAPWGHQPRGQTQEATLGWGQARPWGGALGLARFTGVGGYVLHSSPRGEGLGRIETGAPFRHPHIPTRPPPGGAPRPPDLSMWRSGCRSQWRRHASASSAVAASTPPKAPWLMKVQESNSTRKSRRNDAPKGRAASAAAAPGPQIACGSGKGRGGGLYWSRGSRIRASTSPE